jgi:hypothetical protein
MPDRNSGNVTVQVKISEEGVSITKHEKLSWSAFYEWKDVNEVTIQTSEQNLSPSEETGKDLPLSIISGQINIGGKELGKERSLDEYSVATEEKTFWTELREATGIERDDSVESGIVFPRDKKLVDAFGDFVRFMFEHGYLTREDLPWATPNARKKYILNTEPLHQDGTEMSRPKKAIEDVYFDAKTTRTQRRREVQMIIEQFAVE